MFVTLRPASRPRSSLTSNLRRIIVGGCAAIAGTASWCALPASTHAATAVAPIPVLAGSPDAAYGDVTLRARALDRRGAPLPGLRLRFEADLRGVARDRDGQTASVVHTEARTVTTDATGLATVRLARSPYGGDPSRWFRGTVDVRVRPLVAAGREMTFLAPLPLRQTLQIPPPPTEPQSPPALVAFEAPDTTVDGFPVWLGRDNVLDRVVVVLEGFDLYNRYSATDNIRMVAPAADALRARGLDILVVNFPDSHLPPDALVPFAARAIRAASNACGGRSVAVAGLSAGGLVARWALVEAEQAGAPLPAHLLVLLDTPNRGANLHPALQAMTLRYGAPEDKAALRSDAARVLLAAYIGDPATQVVWKKVGLPLADRRVPAAWTPDTSTHQTFFARLRALNNNNGYPKQTRTVLVANSSRRVRRDNGNAPDLFRMWLPWTFGWTLKTAPEDLRPGSLLPPDYRNRFRACLPLGIAGAYLRTAPTFVSAASALDADPGEAPPGDAWYARPDDLPARAHDDVDAGAAAFVVREILRNAGPPAVAP